MNKVAAHFQDGRVVKGTTADFTPAKAAFHILSGEAGAAHLVEVRLEELKGLFFVKDLEGDLGHAKSNLFDLKDLTPGRRIRILFRDGEVMKGYTQGYEPGRPGFFVIPADRQSNTERAYIVTAAAADIAFL